MTYVESIQLTAINCGSCGGTYAINETYRAQKNEAGGYWNCPYCQCSWGYGNRSANAILKRELAEAQLLREQAEARLRAEKCRVLEEQAAREKLQRKLNRSNKGVCTCCNRSFENLQRHMKTQHPEVAKC